MCQPFPEINSPSSARLVESADSKASLDIYLAVVKDIIKSFDIIESRDNQGNTSLHVASFRGHLPVIEALMAASPSLSRCKNNAGDTFLHMAIAGFRTPVFQRVDRQMELMKQLITGNIVNIHEFINIQNNDGRTALHIALIGNVHSDLVEVLMNIPVINLNIQDIDGLTPLDLLTRSPHSASSEMLIKQLVSAGVISRSYDLKIKDAIVSKLKLQSGIGNSPGISFRISDAEILLHADIKEIQESDLSGRPSSSSSISKNEFPHLLPIEENQVYANKNKTSSSVNNATRRLKVLLGWPRRKEKKTDDEFTNSLKKWSTFEETPIPLRQRFSKGPSSLINNKRTLAVRTSMPSPATKKKFAAGLMHGVIQAMPHLVSPQPRMPVSPLSSSLISSPTSEKQKGIFGDDEATVNKACLNLSGSFSRRSNFKNVNQYFCFGAQDLAVDYSSANQWHGRLFKRSAPPVS